MEAARIPWRPLGRLLVEQGLLTADELELALAQQEKTGRRLGETLVECGFVSGPELSHALAAQYGIELAAETGFGTGLRTEIQRRHETERRGLRPVPSPIEPAQPAAEDEVEPNPADEPDESSQTLQAQLEEQWAKLAAAEEHLAESHRELTALAREYDRRRSQAARLAHRARHAREQLGLQHESSERIEQLERDVRGCDVEIEKLRGECAGLRDELTRAEAAVAEREMQLGQREQKLAEAQAQLVESHRELAALAREYDERRKQAVRFAQGARHVRERVTAAEGATAERERLLEEQTAKLAAAEERLAGSLLELAELARDHDERRGQAGRLAQRARVARAELVSHDERIQQLESDVRGCDLEIERLRREGAGLRDELTGARAAVAERDARLEERRAQLAEAQEQLVVSHRELTAIAREHDHRRSQAARLARRARHARAELGSSEHDELAEQLDRARAECTGLRERLAGADASARERERFLEEQATKLAATEERLAESRRELTGLAREHDNGAQDRETEMERIRDELAGARASAAESARLLLELRRETERRRAQAVRFLERLREQTPGPAPESPVIDSHLVFVHLAGRYELVEQAGPPPARNTVLELPELHGGPLVVAALRRSPLPGDTRPCAFVTPAP